MTTIAVFTSLAVFFECLAVTFGIMPFSTVAPRQPKVALTHAMMSQMMASLFVLLAWAIFYGGLVFKVWITPNSQVAYWYFLLLLLLAVNRRVFSLPLCHC